MVIWRVDTKQHPPPPVRQPGTGLNKNVGPLSDSSAIIMYHQITLLAMAMKISMTLICKNLKSTLFDFTFFLVKRTELFSTLFRKEVK